MIKEGIMITDEMLDALREDIGRMLSEKRYEHTLAVEEMAARIGEIYCPEKLHILRTAALLHDLTKEQRGEGQIELLKKHGIAVNEEMLSAPSTHHAITASLEIPLRYPSLALDEVISSVRYHTTGRAGMTLCEKIIYLSDYIDMTRTYPDCVALREMFWGACPEKMNDDEREKHLNRVILRSLEITVNDLTQRGKTICMETVRAKEWFSTQI